MSFTANGRNGNKQNQLDDKKKTDIENILNDEFCTLQTDTYGPGNTCTIQNLDFRVKRVLVVDLYKSLHLYIPSKCILISFRKLFISESISVLLSLNSTKGICLRKLSKEVKTLQFFNLC